MSMHIDHRALPKRILIVEDEAAIALDLEATLRDAGFVPVGPALTLQDAQTLMGAGPIDAAVLDIGMVHRGADDVLASLIARKIPFIYLTGYGRCDVPTDLPPAATVLKPLHLPDLLTILLDLLKPAS